MYKQYSRIVHVHYTSSYIIHVVIAHYQNETLDVIFRSITKFLEHNTDQIAFCV